MKQNEFEARFPLVTGKFDSEAACFFVECQGKKGAEREAVAIKVFKRIESFLETGENESFKSMLRVELVAFTNIVFYYSNNADHRSALAPIKMAVDEQMWAE